MTDAIQGHNDEACNTRIGITANRKKCIFAAGNSAVHLSFRTTHTSQNATDYHSAHHPVGFRVMAVRKKQL